MKLHEIIPYQSMIRWPSVQAMEDVPIDYMRNCVDLGYFLKDTFGIDSEGIYSGISEECRTILRDSGIFSEWLLKCHEIICLGAEGDRPYGGKSDSNINPSRYAGKLRNGDSQVIAILHKSQQQNVFMVAAAYNDCFAGNYPDFESWDLGRNNKGILRILSMGGISGSGMESLDTERLPGTYRSADIHASLGAEEAYQPDLAGNLLYSAPSSEVIFYYPPGESYIPQYLGVMRQQLTHVFDSIEQNNAGTALEALAGYYQAGIRSQAVRGIWNSVLMGQVNEVLDLMGCNRLPHTELDFMAFCFEEKTFQKFFSDLAAERINIHG